MKFDLATIHPRKMEYEDGENLNVKYHLLMAEDRALTICEANWMEVKFFSVRNKNWFTYRDTLVIQYGDGYHMTLEKLRGNK